MVKLGDSLFRLTIPKTTSTYSRVVDLVGSSHQVRPGDQIEQLLQQAYPVMSAPMVDAFWAANDHVDRPPGDDLSGLSGRILFFPRPQELQEIMQKTATANSEHAGFTLPRDLPEPLRELLEEERSPLTLAAQDARQKALVGIDYRRAGGRRDDANPVTTRSSGFGQLTAEDLVAIIQALMNQNQNNNAARRSTRGTQRSGRRGTTRRGRQRFNTRGQGPRSAVNIAKTDRAAVAPGPGKAPWISQFDPSKVERAGKTACYRACRAMMKAAGIKQPAGTGNRIQVATGEDRTGRVVTDRSRTTKAKNYIDQELAAGRPVTVGVSHKAGYGANRDKITDHFVVVTGKGIDKQGRTFYEYQDPGTRHRSAGENQRFHIDQNDGNLVHQGTPGAGLVSKRQTTMSMVVPRAGGSVNSSGASNAIKTASIKGLSHEQTSNAQTIIKVGQSMGASPRDIKTALMTAMQESTLRNINHGDRDSLGLFQQRPSQGWGTAAQVTDPVYASRKFYSSLFKVKNRDAMSLTQAAQAVQRSAYPDAYAKHEALAQSLLQALA